MNKLEEIKQELVPHLVNERVFCEPGSREFIELDSIEIEETKSEWSSYDRVCKLYRGKVNIKFSGEVKTFPVFIKEEVLHHSNSCVKIQNEICFYKEIAPKLGLTSIPKCYWTGKYQDQGLNYIILEDLQAEGYKVVKSRRLDKEHMKLALEAIAKIHGKGLSFKDNNYNEFRHVSKLLTTIPPEMYTITTLGSIKRLQKYLTSRYSHSQFGAIAKSIDKLLESKNMDDIYGHYSPIFNECENDIFTICHGNFTRDNLMYKYNGNIPEAVKVIDWKSARYSSPLVDLYSVIFLNSTSTEWSHVVVEQNLYTQALRSVYSNIPTSFMQQEFKKKLEYALLKAGYYEDMSYERLDNILSAIESRV
ncbi:uncharacterized protein LOC105700575 [Orussus abietinus]|uniref:uncharacterized protein LOC105700575 n=1 Tax=Orussus abietinus TaxID=222816 RepID=UPI00062632A5|nr:uncharacterized protein LOC105700575 [Orussus abietinus]